MGVLLFLNNPKDLDLSYKTDLDFGIVLEGKTLSHNQRNTVYLNFIRLIFNSEAILKMKKHSFVSE